MTSKLSLTLSQGHLHGGHGSRRDMLVGMGEQSIREALPAACCLACTEAVLTHGT